MYARFPGDIIARDVRGAGSEAGIEIQYSYTISDNKQMYEILKLLCDYEQKNPTGWNRTVDSMVIEWDFHNFGCVVGGLVPGVGAVVFDHSKHAFFENKSEGWSWVDHFIDGARKVFS